MENADPKVTTVCVGETGEDTPLNPPAERREIRAVTTETTELTSDPTAKDYPLQRAITAGVGIIGIVIVFYVFMQNPTEVAERVISSVIMGIVALGGGYILMKSLVGDKKKI